MQDVDKDRAQAFARDACAWLAQRNIPPIPENVELAYNLISGEHPELKRTVESLVTTGCKFDASVMTILHQRDCRVENGQAPIVYRPGCDLEMCRLQRALICRRSAADECGRIFDEVPRAPHRTTGENPRLMHRAKRT